MTGELLRTTLLTIDDSLASVARKLEMTPQNLDGILKTKDIKTGLIERLAKIYDKEIGFFFDDTPVSQHTEGDLSPIAGHDVVIGDAVLAEKVKHLEAMVAEKERLIQVLMKK